MLLLLWPVFVVTTALTGVAILVTGRYPRGRRRRMVGVRRLGGRGAGGGPGLIGLLVLVAGVVLAFSARCPRPLFDLLVGLDRWLLRVAACAELMTDSYPPFRLDMGKAGTIVTPSGAYDPPHAG